MHCVAVTPCINLHFGLSRIVDVLNVEAVPAAQVQAPQRGTYVLPVAPQFIRAKITNHRQGEL